MVATVVHSFVSAKADEPDPTLVRPSDWNAGHTITGVGLTGKQCVPISAGAMTPSILSGPSIGNVETSNGNMFVTLDFDATAVEYAQFTIIMGKSWDTGAFTFQPVWSHATGTGGVVWEMAAFATSDGVTGDGAFGTAQTSVDTGGVADTIYIGPESSGFAASGSVGEGSFVMFRVTRNAISGSDTLTVDARLHAIKLFITTDAGNDE